MPGFDPPVVNPISDSRTQLNDVSAQAFLVKFWGVRGSIPTPGLETARFGGNTACVEVQVAGKRLIFDGGTGLRVLGKTLLPQVPVEAHLFFTHTHWDRIQGFPFFIPAFVEGNCFHIYGSIGPNGASIKQRLSDQMLRPHFPVPLQVMRSQLKFHDISAGSVITIDDITIETVSLNRSNSALGYRITWNGSSVVYATDTAHVPDQVDQSLLYLSQDADLLIYDALYADHNYYDYEFSTEPGDDLAYWEGNLEGAIATNAKQIMIFHHNPAHEDDLLEKFESNIKARFPNVLFAREGMTISVSGKST